MDKNTLYNTLKESNIQVHLIKIGKSHQCGMRCKHPKNSINIFPTSL